jgi:ABC-type sugar transport system ATPase subunit
VKNAGLVLLDEPLANLDYKLREELRIEIPKIFEASGAIFVYATTEPEEALLLGGNTAALWEGRVTEFGPTPEVYRQPVDATTARVFSDPRMNFVQISKTGARLMFGNLPLVLARMATLGYRKRTSVLVCEDTRAKLIQLTRATGFAGRVAVTSEDARGTERLLAASADLVLEPFHDAADRGKDLLCGGSEEERTAILGTETEVSR